MVDSQSTETLLIFRVGPVYCCAPVAPVQGIIVPPHLTRPPGSTRAEPGIFRYQGKVFRVFDLRERFGVAAEDRDRVGRFIITQIDTALLGFWVDAIGDVLPRPGQGWSDLPPQVPREVFSQAFIHQGRITLLTDFASVRKLRSGQLAVHLAQLKAEQGAAEPKPAAISTAPDNRKREGPRIETERSSSGKDDRKPAIVRFDLPPVERSPLAANGFEIRRQQVAPTPAASDVDKRPVRDTVGAGKRADPVVRDTPKISGKENSPRSNFRPPIDRQRPNASVRRAAESPASKDPSPAAGTRPSRVRDPVTPLSTGAANTSPVSMTAPAPSHSPSTLTVALVVLLLLGTGSWYIWDLFFPGSDTPTFRQQTKIGSAKQPDEGGQIVSTESASTAPSPVSGSQSNSTVSGQDPSIVKREVPETIRKESTADSPNKLSITLVDAAETDTRAPASEVDPVEDRRRKEVESTTADKNVVTEFVTEMAPPSESASVTLRRDAEGYVIEIHEPVQAAESSQPKDATEERDEAGEPATAATTSVDTMETSASVEQGQTESATAEAKANEGAHPATGDASADLAPTEPALVEPEITTSVEPPVSDAKESQPALVPGTLMVTDPSRVLRKQILIHVVMKGDTLWHIAIRYLGDPFRYPELARLSDIRNPDLIYPGNKVRIIRYRWGEG